MQRSCLTLAFKSSTLLPTTTYLLLLLLPNPLKFLAIFLSSCFLFLPSLVQGSLTECQRSPSQSTEPTPFISSHPVDLICIQNPTMTHLSVSVSMDSLLYNLITLTPSLAFFLLMICTLAAASSFSSGRTYPFLNFLPPLSLRLTPSMIIYGSALH